MKYNTNIQRFGDSELEEVLQFYSTIGVAVKIDNKAILGLTSYGDIGGTPNKLQTTPLSSKVHTYIEGVQDQDAWECGINYNIKDAKYLRQLSTESPKQNHAMEVIFADGLVCTNQAQVSFKLDGKGVDEVMSGTATFTLAGEWSWKFPGES